MGSILQDFPIFQVYPQFFRVFFIGLSLYLSKLNQNRESIAAYFTLYYVITPYNMLLLKDKFNL
jgi:hypothetical protein